MSHRIGLSGDDKRSLGLYLKNLRVDDGRGEPRAIGLDDPLLCLGLHESEHSESEFLRWTAGRTRLPADLWRDCPGSFLLWVDLHIPALPRWIAPQLERHEAA